MSKYTPCKSCKYERLDFDDHPCAGCFDYTTEKYSRWEPKEWRTKMNDNVSCVNCRFGDCDMDDYPCCLCNVEYDKWEPTKIQYVPYRDKAARKVSYKQSADRLFSSAIRAIRMRQMGTERGVTEMKLYDEGVSKMKIYDEYEQVMNLIVESGNKLDISAYSKRAFLDLLRDLSFLECELTSHPEWEESFDDVVILKHKVAEFYDRISGALYYFRDMRELENGLYRSDQDGQKDDADIQRRDEMHEGMVRDDRHSSIDTGQQTE